jgi:hypothetical protein
MLFVKQSAQRPVFAHGVSQFNRTVFGGVAKFRTRRIPSSTLETTLFIPAITITCFGP